MYKFNITLKSGRIDTFDLFADSIVDVRTIYESLTDTDITNIKKYVYATKEKVKPNEDYYKTVNLIVKNADNDTLHIIIPTVKKSITKDILFKKVKQYLELYNKPITDIISAIKVL